MVEDQEDTMEDDRRVGVDARGTSCCECCLVVVLHGTETREVRGRTTRAVGIIESIFFEMYSRYTEQNIAVNTSRLDAYLDAEAIGDIARQSPSLPMARE